MITTIKLRNFKSWKDVSLDFKPITGLFGTNSSGKTSLLQMLLLLKQTTESSDRAQVLNLGDDRSLVELGTYKDIVLNHDVKSIEFSLKWKLKERYKVSDPAKKGEELFSGDELLFHTEIEENNVGRLIVKKLSYGFDDMQFMMRKKKDKNEYTLSAEVESNRKFKFIRTPGRVWDLPSPVKCYGFPDQVKAYFQNAGFLSDFELKLEELFSHTYYLGPLREYPKRQYTWAGAQPADMGQRGEKVVDALLASRERVNKISRGKGNKSFTVEEYVAYWLRELKVIHDFSVKQIAKGSNLYQVVVKRTPTSPDVLITDVGFGVSQLLPVIALCYYVPEGSTIIMEQPEIHLHPSVQAGLADVFVDAIKKRNVQIILESHSEHLLRRLQRRIADETITNNDAAVYFCEMSDGSSRLEPLGLDMFGNIDNWPEGFFGDEFGEMAAMTKAIVARKQKEQL